MPNDTAYLDEIVLRPLGVDATSGSIAPGQLTEQIPTAAQRKVGDTHVLRAEGDEVVHRWEVVAFDVGTEELPR